MDNGTASLAFALRCDLVDPHQAAEPAKQRVFLHGTLATSIKTERKPKRCQEPLLLPFPRYFAEKVIAVGAAGYPAAPPHGSVRWKLPHTVLTSGIDGQSHRDLLAVLQPDRTTPENPALCPVGGHLHCRSPFLHGLRHRSSGFVRPLPRYYEIV
jgi:hypothetical protein